MFRLDNILERWAAAYKPLSHMTGAKVGKGKAFFRIGAIDTNNEFNRNFNECPHAVMAFSTLIDAQLSKAGRTIDYQYTIYFMVKQVATKSASLANDDEQAMTCRHEGNDMVIDLMAFMTELRKRCINNNMTDHSKEAEVDAEGKTISAAVVDAVGRIAAKMTSEDAMYMAGIDMQTAQWASIPMKYNNWWVMGLQFNGISPKQICVTESLYQ